MITSATAVTLFVKRVRGRASWFGDPKASVPAKTPTPSTSETSELPLCAAHRNREASISAAEELAARLHRICAQLPAGYLQGAADSAGEAVRLLADIKGQGLSDLDTPIQQLEQARDTSRDNLAVLERATRLIDSYVKTVLGFPGTITYAPASPPSDPDGPALAPAAPLLPGDLDEHLFQGHTTPHKITGYHHRPGGIDNGPFRVIEREPTDSREVYRATVEGPTSTGKTVRKKRNTFFPDAWPRDAVRRALLTAFADRQPVFDAKGNVRPRKWEGTYQGIRIQGFIRPDVDFTAATVDDIATAYPVPDPAE